MMCQGISQRSSRSTQHRPSQRRRKHAGYWNIYCSVKYGKPVSGPTCPVSPHGKIQGAEQESNQQILPQVCNRRPEGYWNPVSSNDDQLCQQEHYEKTCCSHFTSSETRRVYRV